MGSDKPVSRVIVYNRQTSGYCCPYRLSHTTVSLIDEVGNVVGTYRIGDASNEIEIDASTFTLPVVVDEVQVQKVKVELWSSSQSLLLGEVEVYDESNTNQAPGMTATQSSTYANLYASLAIDGNPDTFSHTQWDQGK